LPIAPTTILIIFGNDLESSDFEDGLSSEFRLALGNRRCETFLKSPRAKTRRATNRKYFDLDVLPNGEDYRLTHLLRIFSANSAAGLRTLMTLSSKWFRNL
jgi:hypothetical protein